MRRSATECHPEPCGCHSLVLQGVTLQQAAQRMIPTPVMVIYGPKPALSAAEGSRARGCCPGGRRPAASGAVWCLVFFWFPPPRFSEGTDLCLFFFHGVTSRGKRKTLFLGGGPLKKTRPHAPASAVVNNNIRVTGLVVQLVIKSFLFTEP